MKRLNLILLISILNLNGTFSQSYSKVISDLEISELLVWEIDNTEKESTDRKNWKKKIHRKPILWKEAMIYVSNNVPFDFDLQITELIRRDKSYNRSLKKIPELFTESDLKYMKNQFENELGNEWNLVMEKGRLKKNPNNKFYSYSIPLFSKNHQKAIVYKEFYCGSLCAYGSVEVFHKKGKDWLLYKSIPLWVS